MKKLFFLFSAAVLSLGLLSSCGRYESEIKGLDERIKAIESQKITTIENQISLITSSISDLNKLRADIATALQKAEDEGKDITALKEADKALGEKIDELKEYVNQLQKDAKTYVDQNIAEVKNYVDISLVDYATQAWVAATFSTLEQWEETCERLATLEEEVSILEAAAGDVESIKKLLNESIEGVKSWVSEQLADYYTAAQVDNKLELFQRAITAVEEQERISAKEISDLKKQVEEYMVNFEEICKKAIAEAIAANDGFITKTIADAIAGITSDIADINVKLNDLTNRIQAVTFVPEYTGNNAVATYVKKGKDLTFKDLVLNFKITPAAQAAKLTKEELSLDAVLVRTKADSPVLPISKVEVKDKAKGIIAITVAAEDVNAAMASFPVEGKNQRALSVSLNIKTDLDNTCSDYVDVIIKEYRAVENISFDKASIESTELEMEQTLNLSAAVRINPEDASVQDIVWSSSNPETATVDEKTGLITPVKPGEVKIKVTAVENAKKFAEITITVIPKKIHATSVSLGKDSKKTISGYVGEKVEEKFTYTLAETIAPADAYNKNVTWTIEEVVDKDYEALVKPADQFSVVDGTVTIKKEGTFKVTVTTEDGNFTDYCTFIITKATIAFNGFPASLKVGQYYNLRDYVTVTPESLGKNDLILVFENKANGHYTYNNGILHIESAVAGNINVKVKKVINENLTIESAEIKTKFEAENPPLPAK